MHVGGDQTEFLIGPRSTSLVPSSLLRRAVVSADRRFAIGFGGSRVVRIDLTRGYSPAESAFVVLLDGVFSPDAWIRRSLAPSTAAPAILTVVRVGAGLPPLSKVGDSD